MAEFTLEDNTIKRGLPVRVPEFTLRFTGAGLQGVSVDGRPLTRALSRVEFQNNTFYR